MMISRTQAILVVAFGIVLVLTGLAGWLALRQIDELHRTMSAAHEFFQRSDRALNDVRADIHLSGVLFRDFLLDPSHLTAGLHREQLAALRSSIDRKLSELEAGLAEEERSAVARLRGEVRAYWESREPLFEWSPREKAALGPVFLRDQVIPRRAAVVAMAEEVRQLIEKHWQRRQALIDQSRREFRERLLRVLGGAVFLGLLVAVATTTQISRLERRSELQRKQTELAEQEMRQLSRQLVHAQESERAALSRELHDQVGQMLTGLRVELGNLNQVRNGREEVFETRLSEARRLVEETMRAVRDMAMGLRPSMLDDLGLGPALEWQARDFSRRHGVPVSVQIEGTLAALPDQHRTCIYRVVQEALTNCARHARASSIRVTLHHHRDRASLVVQDDGIGFDTRASGKGLGLVGIQERVRELGGMVTVTSQPGKGTVLAAEIPIPNEEGA
jgi:signal transduction histidine kinase